MKYLIRPYQLDDRKDIRRIACETSFLELDRTQIFSDDEILADCLTAYYTDYEPQSCFVAEYDHRVVGYIIGSVNVKEMEKCFKARLLWPLVKKILKRNVLFKRTHWKLIVSCLKSILNGEISSPDFTHQYPATLHINLDPEFRKQGAGRDLINYYLNYLKENKVLGVHFGSFSDDARDFFLRMGFQELFKSKRSYLKPYLNKEINCYVFGKKIL